MVWGAYLTIGSFKKEAAWRIEQDEADGWQIAYQRINSKWASWSGMKDGKIFYQRAIAACNGAAAYFRKEYQKSEAVKYDEIVVDLVNSLRSREC